MKKTMKILLGLPVLLAFLMVGCSLDTPEQTTDLVAPVGEQAFGNFAAMGNSLTAGFQDGGLCVVGQSASYPLMIAQQLGMDVSLTSSEFTQPYIAMPGIGSTGSADPTKINGVLHFNGTGVSVLGTHDVSDVLDATSPNNPLMARSLPVPYINHGVPGATLHDVMNAFDGASSDAFSAENPMGNSYFNFINRASLFSNTSVPPSAGPPPTPGWETSSMFWQTVAAGPTLTTLWIGNHDILGGAMGGNPVIGENITDAAAFQAEYTALLGTLAGALVKRTGHPTTIVVANIPSITTVPYFMTEATFEAALPEALGGSWPLGYEEGEISHLTFPVLTWMAAANPTTDQIPSKYTLTAAEVLAVETQVATFNGIIDAVASGVEAQGYATVGVVDANSLMADIHSGTYPDAPYGAVHFMFLLGQGLSVEDASNATLFSLDGVHPNSRGYGIIANAFIDKINELQDTDVAHVDWKSLNWDPTYGTGSGKNAVSGTMPTLDAEAAHAMRTMFR